MPGALADEVMARIEKVGELYHRLLLVVGPNGTGKTAALQALAELTSSPLMNLNLELSSRLLELTERERALHLHEVLDQILEGAPSLVLLDNIELLFDPALQQDPLRLLQKLSRSRTLIVAWTGRVEGDHLLYAAPEHSEYRRYPTRDLVLMDPELVA